MKETSDTLDTLKLMLASTEYDRRNKYPSKTLQKPLEAILKPSKGFSLLWYTKERERSQGAVR